MKTELKYIAVSAGIILMISAIIFGALLPLLKSQRYIAAINMLSSIRTFKDFEANFDNVFNFYSPVGGEEVAKFLGNDIISFAGSSNQTEQGARELVSYMEPHMFQNNVRHLLMLSQMYRVLWQRFHKEADFEKAEAYLRKAHSIGSNLPPVLYSLYDLYQQKGDLVRAREIGESIVAIWPEEKNIAAFLRTTK